MVLGSSMLCCAKSGIGSLPRVGLTLLSTVFLDSFTSQMLSPLRHSLRLSTTRAISRPTNLTASPAPTPLRRAYGSKKAPIATTSLKPGSQQALTDPAARDEFARADAKMVARVEWLRREVAQLEARASGRVTPQLLAPVRVSVAHSASASASASSGGTTKKVRLEELATVGVRDGSSLIVTIFDPQVSEPCCVMRCGDRFPPSSAACAMRPPPMTGCPLIGRMLAFQ